MNKLTEILILGLMSCVLCGCMSDEEWHREKKVIVANFVSSHPEWKSENRDYVLEGKIVNGMTVEQVKWAWWRSCWWLHAPPPNEWDRFDRYFELISVSPGREVHTTYWPIRGRSGEVYLYFSDGKLESWSWYPR